MSRLNLKNLGLATLSGLLFALSWPGITPIPYFIFFAFIPLLKICDDTQTKFPFLLFYLSFFIWNSITTWWIWHASPFGAVFAILANSLLMAITFYVFFLLLKKFPSHQKKYYLLIPVWISFEFVHMHWDLSWPWLTLGNVFSNNTLLIQWYEYTGHLGGSVWILLVNVLLFILSKVYQKRKSFTLSAELGLLLDCLIFLPLISIWIKSNTTLSTENKTEVVIVQPNIDPYFDKFDNLSSKEQIQKLLSLAEKKISPQTKLVVGPETCIPKNIEETKLLNAKEIELITAFSSTHNLSVLTGLSTYRLYKDAQSAPATAREYKNGVFLDFYNTAGFIDQQSNIELYHKSKLVPGVEKMPFGTLLKPLEKYALDLGGTTGSLGIQKNRSVFNVPHTELKVGPIICYESIYGSFVGEYINAGANILAIITNDGWWKNTPGYHQHLAYGRLRAIEHRKTILRSANTGISCVIDEKGNLIPFEGAKDRTNWWQEDVFNINVFTNNTRTFYTRFGDYIGWMSLLTLLSIVLSLWFKKPSSSN